MTVDWNTLCLVVELPVHKKCMTTAQLRWALERIFERCPPEQEFLVNDRMKVGKIKVKDLIRQRAAQRDDVFWGNAYGKKEGWALRCSRGKWFFITTDRRKLESDAAAERYVRARAQEDTPAYYDDAVALVDGRA